MTTAMQWGRVYERPTGGGNWWIAYYNGRGDESREPAAKVVGKPRGTATEADAHRALKRRYQEILGGRFVGPQAERVTIQQLLDAYRDHCLLRGCKVVHQARLKDGSTVYRGRLVSCLTHVAEAFGDEPAINVTAARIDRWVADMLAANIPPGSAKVYVAYLRAALLLAKRQGRLAAVPYFPTIEVRDARQGFVDRDELARIVAALPDPINDVAQLAYMIGWRKREVLDLQWAMLDRVGGVLRLPDSKNGEGRVVPVAGAVATLIEKRWRLRALTPWVFHAAGQQVRWINQQWNRACREAKVPGRLFHDLRRSAIRNMEAAGVPRSAAMRISGHKTEAMYRRYAVTSTDDLRQALERVEAFREGGTR